MDDAQALPPTPAPEMEEDRMRNITAMILTAAAAASLCTMQLDPAVAGDTASANAAAQATYRDIEQTLGMMPSFFKAFPEAGIEGAWTEFKSIQLNPKTSLDGKTKELIGLAVAAQIPCQYCI